MIVVLGQLAVGDANLDLDGRLQAQLRQVSLATGTFAASVTGLKDLANMLTSGGVTVLAFAGERNTFPSEVNDALQALGTASSTSAAIVLLAQTPAAMNVLKGAFPVAGQVTAQAGIA